MLILVQLLRTAMPLYHVMDQALCNVCIIFVAHCVLSLPTDDTGVGSDAKGQLQRQATVSCSRHGEKLAKSAGGGRVNVTVAIYGRSGWYAGMQP